MSYCYIFQKGRIVLKSGISIPDSSELALFSDILSISGNVDRENICNDKWVILKADEQLPEGYETCERRMVWTKIGEEKFFRMAKAFHYADWRSRYKFCSCCGTPLIFDEKEFAMHCTKCGEFFYPVICPAIIVAVEKEGKILMGHGNNFPKGRYSVLAGFVEPGESLEDCVRREIYEEAKIKVKNIKYFGSQPWSFPRSLMLGFNAEWESGEPTPDRSELSDVRWFAPNEIPEYYRGMSISGRLIEDFALRHGVKL